MDAQGVRWSYLYEKGLPGMWTPFLGMGSFLYGAAVRCRLVAYGAGLLKRKALPGFVVSVGNITVGGTGKTPAVIMLAQWAKEEGYRVAVLSRGYGGSYDTDVLEVSNTTHVKSSAQECGDEPYLLATKLPGIPVIVSKNRYAAGMRAHDRFDSNLFVLDDGFQHVALKRDLDLVLIDSSNGFGNGHLLPLGPLREPIVELARGDAYVLTRWQNSSSGDELIHFLRSRFPDKPIFRGEHMPKDVVFPIAGERRPPDFLGGKRVLAFAGIARPNVLWETLTRLGADVVHRKGFRDHHPFGREDFQELLDAKDRMGAEYLITTEKDWVRVAHLASNQPSVGYMDVRFELINDKEDFYGMLRRLADRSMRYS